MNEDEIAALRSRIENRIERAWRSMVREIKDDNSLADIAARIARGDADVLVGVDDAAEKVAIDINTGYVQAGQRTSRWLDSQVDSRVPFNPVSDDAVGWMTDQSQSFVSAVAREQNDVARRVIADGRARGLTPMDIAEEVRDSIGLNEQQFEFVQSYREALESGAYRNAIGRELADGRYDAALRRADAAGTELEADRVDAMVSAYRRNWVGRRGEFVSQMEGQAAMGAGTDEAIDQAVQRGDVAPGALSGTWNTMDDGRVRSSHVAMDGQTRPYGTPFTSGYGNRLRYPGDEDAPAADTAGCRCWLEWSLARPRDADAA